MSFTLGQGRKDSSPLRGKRRLTDSLTSAPQSVRSFTPSSTDDSLSFTASTPFDMPSTSGLNLPRVPTQAGSVRSPVWRYFTKEEDDERGTVCVCQVPKPLKGEGYVCGARKGRFLGNN